MERNIDTVAKKKTWKRLLINVSVFALGVMNANAATINVSTYEQFKQALQDSSSGDTIKLLANIAITENLGTLNKSLNIDSGGYKLESNATAGLTVASGYTLTLNGGNWTGFTTANGGSVSNNGTLNINSTIFTSNSATNRGGAVYVGSGNNLNITNSTFTSNSATADWSAGGAISNANGGQFNTIDADFTSNSAQYGGAVYNFGGGSSINELSGSFTGNTATPTQTDRGLGGAILNENGAYIGSINANFTSNAANHGGAIMNAGGVIYEINHITSSKSFTSNTATQNGGAIVNTGTITYIGGDGSGHSNFVNNQVNGAVGADNVGGAIDNSGTISYIYATFDNNIVSSGRGGAIFNYKTIGYQNGDFISNKAGTVNTNASSYGGAIYNVGSFSTVQSNFTSNSATANSGYAAQGGAIYNGKQGNNVGSISNITGNFTDNSTMASTAQGGAIFNTDGGDIFYINGNFTSNSVSSGGTATGGAILNNWSHIGTINGNFTSNHASGVASTMVGGAIDNSGTIDKISGDFTSNYIAKGQGGAIFNWNTITEIEGSFTGNHIDDDTGLGAAIYNHGTLGLAAKTKDIVFEDNYVGAEDNLNDIHNEGTLNLNLAEDHTMTFQGTITDVSTPTGLINVGYSAGSVYFNNSVTQKKLNINNSDSNVYISAANLNIKEGTTNAGSLFISSGVNDATTDTSHRAITNNSGGKVYIDGATFSNHLSTSVDGAVLYSDVDTLTEIQNSDFISNAGYSGGAIYNKGDNMKITGGSFVSNTGNNGGALENKGANMFISSVAFTSNQASSTGGAIYNVGTDAEIVNSNFTSNVAGTDGSAIYNLATGSIKQISDTDFSANSGSGGALTNLGVITSINIVNFNNNIGGWGSAIFNSGSSAQIDSITNASFEGNSARWNGGAIQNHDGGQINNLQGYFISNHANHTGGALANLNSTIDVLDADFVSNYLEGEEGTDFVGGAIDNSGLINKINGDFAGNYINGAGRGGAIFNYGTINEISGNFENNYVNGTGLGGAIWTRSSLNFVADGDVSIFKDNYVLTDEGEKDYQAIWVDDADATLTFNAKNDGEIFMYDYIDGVDGYKVNITGNNTGTMYLYNDIKNADVSVDSTTLDIGNSAVNLKNVTFAGDSTLALKINTLDDYGLLTAEKININEGAKLKATLAPGLATIGKISTVQLLNADNKDFNNFVDEFDNNMYYFEKADKNGAYNISLVKTAEDVANEAGAEPWVAEAAGAYIDKKAFDAGTVSAEIADKLADLAQNDAGGLIDTLKALAPAETDVVQTQSIEETNRLFKTVDSYLRGERKAMGVASGDNLNGVSVWGKAYVGESKISDRGDVSGSDADSKGAIAGIEKKLNKSVKIGAGLQYDRTDINTFRHDIDVHSLMGFAYGEYKPSRWFVNGVLSYGKSSYDEDKFALGNTYNAKYDAYMASIAAMTGYQFKYLTPEIGLRYYHIKTEDYTDTAGQSVDDDKSDILRGVFGVRFARGCGIFRPNLYLGLTYDIFADKSNTTVSLANGTSYTVAGKRLNRLGYEASTGVSVAISDNITASVLYLGAYRKNYREHTGMFNIKYSF